MTSHQPAPAASVTVPMNPINAPETIPLATLPKGFRYSSAACGLRRKNRLDVGAIVAENPVSAAGIFTSNLVKAAPVLLCQEHIAAAASGSAR